MDLVSCAPAIWPGHFFESSGRGIALACWQWLSHIQIIEGVSIHNVPNSLLRGFVMQMRRSSQWQISQGVGLHGDASPMPMRPHEKNNQVEARSLVVARQDSAQLCLCWVGRDQPAGQGHRGMGVAMSRDVSDKRLPPPRLHGLQIRCCPERSKRAHCLAMNRLVSAGSKASVSYCHALCTGFRA